MLNNKTISLVIPAHNEAANIWRVLAVVRAIDFLDEIIVVADACSDATAEVAARYGVKILVKETTKGKGEAMRFGAAQAVGVIIMFCDADLLDLTPEHVRQVVTPVAAGEAVMSVGLRDRVCGLGALTPKIFPSLAIAGERAMTIEFFQGVAASKVNGYGIETTMNLAAQRAKLPVAYPVLRHLHQVIKEKKWGLRRGLVSRLSMTWQIVRAYWRNKTPD